MPRRKKPNNPDAQDTYSQDTRARVALQDTSRKQREAQVIELRVQGWSFARIAAEVGYSDQSGAHKAWKRALANIPKASADEQRDHLRMQLEDMSDILYRQLKRGNTRAGEALIKLQERYCKMLNLDLLPDAGNGAQIIPVPIEREVFEAV